MAGEAAGGLDLMKDRGVDATLALCSRVSVLSQLGMEGAVPGQFGLQELLLAGERDAEDERLG